MPDISQEITEAITRSLPQHVGEALKKELDALAELRKSYATLDQQYDKLQVQTSSAQRQAAALQSELKQHQELAVREAAVTRREDTQNLNDLLVQLADARRHDMLSLVGMVFKSPVYRENVKGMIPVACEGKPASQYDSGSCGYPVQSPIDTTTTTSTD